MRPLNGFLSILYGLALGCGSSSGANGDGGPDASIFADVTAITISPASAEVSLAAGDAGVFSAAQSYTVTATFRDGSTRDVTALALWSASDASVTVPAGQATATLPGSFTISVLVGIQTSSATLNVDLVGATDGTGFASGDEPKLDATPTEAGKAQVAYPLDGALFPANLTPITVHATKTTAAQAIARIHFTAGSLLDERYYAPCEAGPNSNAGCYVTLPTSLTTLFIKIGATADIGVQTRVANADGSHLAEGDAIHVAWADMNLTGGLYYWTTIPASQNNGSTGIERYDFSGDTSHPQLVYTDKGSPVDHSDGNTCVGCHAISRDGTKLALTIGGSYPSDFRLMDIGSSTQIALQNAGPDGYATQTSFNPDGTRMIQMYRGLLTLRTADATLASLGSALATAANGELKSDGFWSPDGQYFAFVSWIGDSGQGQYEYDGDMKPQGEIWVAPSDGQTVTDSATLIVARPQNGAYTSYYPAISDDASLLVFNRSDCSGPAGTGYGAGACDGYNDQSARIFLTTPAGATPIDLARSNGESAGGANPNTTNSWPKWSPDHGTFRGKRLYWIAFSSIRAYGLQVNQAPQKPQLWFTAVAVPSGGLGTSDPSYPPVWLPGQNPDQANPNGNHAPQWVVKAVRIGRGR